MALLAFLKVVFEVRRLEPLAPFVVFGLLAFHLGIVAALIHNKYRRDCSLIHEHYDYRPPGGTLWVFKLKEPRVCGISKLFRFLSITMFLLGGLIVGGGALWLLRCS